MVYSELTIKEKENFKKVCNKLLSTCLICKQKEDTRGDYYFVEGHLEAINSYFKPLGFEVELNKTIKSAQLINKFGINKYNFKLIESITLLILRILYSEKMQELSLSQNVIVEIEELQSRFIALGFKDRLMDKTLLRQSLSTLKKFNIIDTLDRDMTLSESRILVYPTILMVVRSENIDAVYEKLNNYNRKGVDEGEKINRN